MGTEIKYQTYSGGDGSGDGSVTIGYCKEEPFDVLKKLLFTHDIYDFLGLYRPIDYGFPNNVSGLCIIDSNGPNGCGINSSLENLDLSCAKTENHRTKESILESLDYCKKWHDNDWDAHKVIWDIVEYVKTIDVESEEEKMNETEDIKGTTTITNTLRPTPVVCFSDLAVGTFFLDLYNVLYVKTGAQEMLDVANSEARYLTDRQCVSLQCYVVDVEINVKRFKKGGLKDEK